MSMLTEIVIIVPFGDDEAIASINKAFAESAEGQELKRVVADTNDHFGGQKVPSSVIYGACYNHFPVWDLEKVLQATSWKHAWGTVVYVDAEVDEQAWVWVPWRGPTCKRVPDAGR